MIYCIITDTNNAIDTNKRDCRIIRQPLNLLPDEIKKFVDDTKNASVRAERLFAYTSLLLGLKEFFGIDNCSVRKNNDGKPYLSTVGGYQYVKDGKEIHISISHSEGLTAVCISDENEVGIDIQCEIDGQRANRLGKRFFGDIHPTSEEVEVKYFICNINDDEAMIYSTSLPDSSLDSFTEKWTYSESLMKLSGGGFGDLSKIHDIAKISKTQIKKYPSQGGCFIAISVKR
ncbi:MAG: hypothetical protein J6V80_02630 [Clostridia bacterium]|nr:hypothetical protein [Clostridia bacterium]